MRASTANSVLAFGARGDGTAVDTRAVQAAIDAGGVTYFPAGDYRLGTLTIPSDAVLCGAASGGYGTTGSRGPRSRLLLDDDAGGHLIYGSSGAAHVRIADLHLDGNNEHNVAGDLVHLADADEADEAQWHITGCFLENSPRHGLYVGQRRQAVKVSRCVIYGSMSTGAILHGSDGELQTVIVGRSGRDGMEITGWVTRIVGCDVWGSGRTGINLYAGVHDVAVIGTGIDRNARHGLYVGGTSDGISVVGCAFHTNSQEAHDTYPHIKQDTVNNPSGTSLVVGCTFDHDDDAKYPNKPSWAVEVAAGLVDARANRVTPSGAVRGYISTGPIASTSGGWTLLTPWAGWATNAGSNPLQYRIVDDRLWLRGVLHTSAGVAAGDTVAMLPAGARPRSPLQLTLAGGGAVALTLTRVDISSSGVVTVAAAQPPGGLLFFDAVSYPLF